MEERHSERGRERERWGERERGIYIYQLWNIFKPETVCACGNLLHHSTTVVLFSITWYLEGRKEMFDLTTHSTHFNYGYMASDIWLKTILIARKETRCRHMGYSFRLTARVLLYAPSHRQDSTYHGLCYTSRGTLVGTRNSSMGPPHEGSIRRPIAPWISLGVKPLRPR